MKNSLEEHGKSLGYETKALFENYAGDITLTPTGLQYLGMVKRPPNSRSIPFQVDSLDVGRPARRAV